MVNFTVKALQEQELGDRNATQEHYARSGFAIPSKRARITDHVVGSRGKKFQSSVGSSFSPSDQHGNSLSQASAGSTTVDYQQRWPFIKRSPTRATIKFYSQKPHFAPLKEMNEDYREGLAIAQMVTYENLVQTISCLNPGDPVDDITNNSLETLSHLKTHGFDVGSIQDHLNRLLSLKSKVCEHEDSLREVEEKLQKYNHEKSLMEIQMKALKVRIRLVKSVLATQCRK